MVFLTIMEILFCMLPILISDAAAAAPTPTGPPGSLNKGRISCGDTKTGNIAKTDDSVAYEFTQAFRATHTTLFSFSTCSTPATSHIDTSLRVDANDGTELGWTSLLFPGICNKPFTSSEYCTSCKIFNNGEIMSADITKPTSVGHTRWLIITAAEGSGDYTVALDCPTSAPTMSPTTVTSIPTTNTPTTTTPTTAIPTTNSPTTDTPTTYTPTTDSPTTSIPTTNSPTTNTPTTNIPTTDSPTTDIPTTDMPTTAIPTTAMPSTMQPSTVIPTTAQPTPADPTTQMPTTDVPTTANPTTIQPSTSIPTTSIPTTQIPSMANVIANSADPTQSPTYGEAAQQATATQALSAAGVKAATENEGLYIAKDSLLLGSIIGGCVISFCLGILITVFCVKRRDKKKYAFNEEIKITVTSGNVTENGNTSNGTTTETEMATTISVDVSEDDDNNENELDGMYGQSSMNVTPGQKNKNNNKELVRLKSLSNENDDHEGNNNNTVMDIAQEDSDDEMYQTEVNQTAGQ